MQSLKHLPGTSDIKGNDAIVISEQPEKADLPKLVTKGKIASVKERQKVNAFRSIVVTLGR